jgi:Na+/phosphate symporter
MEGRVIGGSRPALAAKHLTRLKRAFCFALGVYLFVLALELTKGGAAALRAVFPLDGSRGLMEAFGLGWLLACVFLSGSPVAALSLGLFAAEIIESLESYAMIMGSRMGASFVVLAIGFVYDVRAKKATGGTRGGVYVGALALLVTASVYLPALGLGSLLLSSGVLDGLAPVHLGKGLSVIEVVFGPALHLAEAHLPAALRALAGIGLILAAFRVFDAGLPGVDPTGGRLGQMATTIYRPSIAFLFGMIVTAITLSVSVSLSLLVPLTVRGVVRRENLIPFILGANITTFVDTLVASLLVGHPGAFPVVLASALVVSAISLPIVLLAYRPYETLIDGAATWITARRRRLGAFVALLLAVPVALVFLSRLSW